VPSVVPFSLPLELARWWGVGTGLRMSETVATAA